MSFISWRYDAEWYSNPLYRQSIMRAQRAMPFKQRLLTELRRLDSLDAVKMFQPSCLICGRPLTDPISMARGIGPECAGKTNFDARNRNLTARTAEEQAA